MPELETAVDAIRTRFGDQALLRGSRLPPVEPWTTELAPLDRLSGIGGLPRGRLTVLTGRGTCGKLSLGLDLLARASRDLAQAVVIDPARGFDPWSLALHRADLDCVAAVRPPDAGACGEAALALARAGCGLLLLLLPASLAAGCEPWLPALEGAASRSGTVLLAVAEDTPPPLAHSSSLTLCLERTDWLLEAGAPGGLRARLRCVKNRVGAPGRSAELVFRYPRGVEPLTEAAIGEAPAESEEEAGWRSAAG